MKIKKQVNRKKIGTVLSIIALVTFIAIAGITAFTGFNTRREVEDKTIANIENSPKAWGEIESKNVVANSSLSGEVIDSKYIQWTVAITNSNSGDSLYVTHLAAFLSEDENKSGFIPLASNSLEYSYTPDNASSWTKIGLGSPGSNENAFKLNSDLHLGTLGTATDTVYFRFYIEPERGTKRVNNKVSFLMRNSKGEAGYASSVAMIAYEDSVLAEAQALAKADAGDGTTSENYADPLGMFSFIPNVDVVTSVVASTTGISQEFLIVAAVLLGIGVIIFIICLAAYVPIARKK